MKRKDKKNSKKNFELDWNINNIDDFNEALGIFEEWAENPEAQGSNLRAKDVILSVNPILYNRLSRGDKCRVGKAVSIRFAEGRYGDVCRGKKKGATNTYSKLFS